MVNTTRIEKTATAFKPGTIVMPAMQLTEGDWRLDLRGYVIKSTDTTVLVKWNYEALGSDPLAAYWMVVEDVKVPL